jgi:hypothetical protein
VEAADVALPIGEYFANSDTARHKFVDKLRIFALAEYFFATAASAWRLRVRETTSARYAAWGKTNLN